MELVDESVTEMNTAGLSKQAQWLKEELGRESRMCPWCTSSTTDDQPQGSLEADLEAVHLLDGGPDEDKRLRSDGAVGRAEGPALAAVVVAKNVERGDEASGGESGGAAAVASAPRASAVAAGGESQPQKAAVVSE